MARSQNGYTASLDHNAIDVVPFAINGVEYVGGVRGGDVFIVLHYVMQQVANRVEAPVNPGCWGWSYRPNRNDPNALSNHSSGTAVDHNAPQHPNGRPTLYTWSKAQVAEIHKILADVDGVVRWGGDYQHTPDAMHFEINADLLAVRTVAEKLRATRGPNVDAAIEALRKASGGPKRMDKIKDALSVLLKIKKRRP